MNFDQAFAALYIHEKGFQDNPNDKGNWTGGNVGVGVLRGTKFGISAASYPLLDIERLTLADAKDIYKRDFWDRMQLDRIPEKIRFDLFDMAVHSGPGNAARTLQKAVDVADDGWIGPVTLAAVAKMPECQLVARFNAYRLKFLLKLTTWREFGGWFDRVANNLLRL